MTSAPQEPQESDPDAFEPTEPSPSGSGESPEDDDNLVTGSNPESTAETDGSNTGMRPDQAKPDRDAGSAGEH